MWRGTSVIKFSGQSSRGRMQEKGLEAKRRTKQDAISTTPEEEQEMHKSATAGENWKALCSAESLAAVGSRRERFEGLLQITDLC